VYPCSFAGGKPLLIKHVYIIKFIYWLQKEKRPSWNQAGLPNQEKKKTRLAEICHHALCGKGNALYFWGNQFCVKLGAMDHGGCNARPF
jgi:hypothetical protein